MAAVLDLCADATGGSLTSGGCYYGGLTKLYYGRFQDLTFTVAGDVVTNVTVAADKDLYEIEFDVENASYTSSLQNGAFYNNDIVVNVDGKSSANWETITHLRSLCGDLVFFAFGRTCGARVIGASINAAGDGLEKDMVPMRLVEHTDTSGNVGDRTRDELTFRSQSDYAPPFTTITKATLDGELTA